jgi:type II secretory ATPase GspE/PulE/Tfp pilus assembly ATPase PilB-like protein
MSSQESVFTREPLLGFMRDQQFMNAAEFSTALHPQTLWLDGTAPHLLNQLLAARLEGCPEERWLHALLCHPVLAGLQPAEADGTSAAGQTARPSVLASYLPAPGQADASPLAPPPTSAEFLALVPRLLHRSMAWIVRDPCPTLVLLTYDPGTLPLLFQSDGQDFWRHRLLELFPDVTLATAPLVGLTSPHQFLQPQARWRRFPVSLPTADLCEQHLVEPILETELAVYAWRDPLQPAPAERALRDLANLLQKLVFLHPRPFLSQLGQAQRAPVRIEHRLLNAQTEHWRRFFLDMLDACAAENDSDIHIQPKERGGLAILRRRSGFLQFEAGIPAAATAAFYAAVLSGTGIEMDLNPSKPKDGRTSIYLPHLARWIDLRLSLLPARPPFRAPAIIIRLLDPTTVRGGLGSILTDPVDHRAWDFAMDLRAGLVVVTGPTGSGKSRTLYSALQTKHAREPGLSFKSVEDPIEFNVGDWLQQNQLSEESGVGFGTMIRGFLRSDPNVIFVGEIRDADGAQAAAQLVLNGFLVVTTLHVAEPALAPQRLFDLGVHPNVLRSALRFVTSQRLVGRSCPQCRSDRPPTEAEIARHRHLLGDTHPLPSSVRVNSGCAHCHDLGIRGRVAVQEYLVNHEDDSATADAIAGRDFLLLRSRMAALGFPNLRQRALPWAYGPEARIPITAALHVK